jgi:hypothetical protein
MHWSDFPTRPSEKMLRQFAGLWLLFFGGLAGWQWLGRDRPLIALAVASLAVVVGVAGLISPRLVRPVFLAWMILAFPVGWVVSNVLLAGLFYGLFTPVGLLWRLTGRDPLRRRGQPDQESYWLPRSAARNVRDYFRQS